MFRRTHALIFQYTMLLHTHTWFLASCFDMEDNGSEYSYADKFKMTILRNCLNINSSISLCSNNKKLVAEISLKLTRKLAVKNIFKMTSAKYTCGRMTTASFRLIGRP